MRYFVISDAQGEIREVIPLQEGFLFDPNLALQAHPGGSVQEVSQSDYEKVKGQGEYFVCKKGKIQAKSALDRKSIDEGKNAWKKNNTLSGLQEQLEELRGEIRKKEV